MTAPTGGDSGLGTPNQDFGGPGNGSGGQQGEDGENSIALGNILIISEDADSGDPDDCGNGGTLTFDFDDPVRLDSIQLVDVNNSNSTLKLYDESNSLITTIPIPSLGRNSVQRVEIRLVGVARLEVNLSGDGGVVEVVSTEPVVIAGSGRPGRRHMQRTRFASSPSVLTSRPNSLNWRCSKCHWPPVSSVPSVRTVPSPQLIVHPVSVIPIAWRSRMYGRPSSTIAPSRP